MKYFLDTKFIENGRTLDLISIGIVSEDDRRLYLQNEECDFRAATDWVWRNIYPRLEHFHMAGCTSCGSESGICKIGIHGPPEFWGYCPAYDWVAFCQLFGTMFQLPNEFPPYCRDVRQWADQLGIDKIPLPSIGRDHALFAAKGVKSAYEFLSKISLPKPAS